MFCATSAIAQPAVVASRKEQQVVHRIDSILRKVFPAKGPGAVIAIEKDSDRLFAAAYGNENLDQPSATTLQSVFNIGSLTKQFTALVILQLAEEKKLVLAAPVGLYVNGLPPFIAVLRIDQLLSHASGLPDHYGFTDTNRVKHATDSDVVNALRRADTLYFAAGTRYRYSNSAYCLLGIVIEKCSGLTYAARLQQSVFGPLGLTHSAVLNPVKIISGRVTGYEPSGKGRWKTADEKESIFFSTEADGGICTSIEDYMAWCRAWENGVIGKAAVDQAWTGHTLVDTLGNLRYGYGWFVVPGPDGLMVYHTGFNGGFRTAVFLIPALHYRIVLFAAGGGPDLEELIHRINAMLDVPDTGFIKSGPLES